MAKPRVALPPGLLIRAVKWVWTTLWRQMMAQLAPASKSGAYQRPESQFRHQVTAGGILSASGQPLQFNRGHGVPLGPSYPGDPRPLRG